MKFAFECENQSYQLSILVKIISKFVTQKYLLIAIEKIEYRN